MAGSEEKKTYWPHMILGFIAIGLGLGFWTVKSTVGLPVHESNEYMMKYQEADLDANEILEAQHRFDARYRLSLEGMKLSDFKEKNLKRKGRKIVRLDAVNRIVYRITDHSGNPVTDANVSLLLTRPHTEKDDQFFPKIQSDNGNYAIPSLRLKKPGRYILRVRAQKGDAVGYLDTPGYYRPPEH